MDPPNGLSKGYPDSYFDPGQLAAGTEVEFEHTTDKALARKIAKDHLVEDPAYYIKLYAMEHQPWNYYLGRAMVPLASKPDVWWTVSLAGALVAGYHGYKRSSTVGSAVAWAVGGAALPLVTVTAAIAQGFAEPKSV